jgi:hypothetical protein
MPENLKRWAPLTLTAHGHGHERMMSIEDRGTVWIREKGHRAQARARAPHFPHVKLMQVCEVVLIFFLKNSLLCNSTYYALPVF